MKRLLVTGSRSWTDRDAITDALDDAVDTFWPNSDPDNETIVLVHGDARGADRLAAEIWTKRWSMPTEPHPADWTGPCRRTCRHGHRRVTAAGTDTICPAAGLYRNIEMVELGADLVLAFILDSSAGASQCARLAAKAGIEVRRIEAAS